MNDFFDYEPADLAGTGRHLTKDELWVWTRFLDASRLLEEALARHVSRHHAMTHSDYEVLVRLDGAGGEMRMAALAEQVVSSAQKLTHTANRLEQRGWIARRPTATDGRGLVAVLLAEGRAALEAAAGEHAELIQRFLLAEMSPDEREVVAAVMSRTSAHLRTHRAGHPCPVCNDRDS